MIPADVASRLRLNQPDLPLPPQPVATAQKLTDALSDLVPGQRILAQIQSILPNNVYRALVGQREVTLSLPFAAKTGDSLELEVTENDGKVSLAFVANRGDGKTPPESLQQQSVSTRLSQTGRLIGDLLSGIGEEGKRAQPAPLQGNAPLTNKLPVTAADLVPVLKEALARSGMFYEAHQARWIEGKLPTAALLAEPQGKLSSRQQPPTGDSAPSTTVPGGATVTEEGKAPLPAPPHSPREGESPRAGTGAETLPPVKDTASSNVGLPLREHAPAGTSSPVHPQLVAIVQQQLDALSTNHYVWQGQAWPGQNMEWEIHEEGNPGGGDEIAEHWQTRMTLTLPSLGGIEATLRLRAGSQVDISLRIEERNSLERLNATTTQLREQFEAAGLALTACSIRHGEDSF